MFKKSLLSLMMLCFAFFGVARAQSELTIYEDGTATNSYVPVYGTWADAYQKCEFVVPADELSDMNGGTISQMDFYLTSPAAAAWTGTFQVFLMEVAETSISAFYGPDDATVVYEGTLDATASPMSVVFSENYTYAGGNLLVGVYEIASGNWKSATFQGETVEGACVQGYSSSGLSGVSPTQRNFIPTTKFTYTPGSGPVCERPASLVASDVTAHGATLTWESEVGNYSFEYKLASEEEWTALPLDVNTYTLTGLNQNTAYNTRVKAICGEGLESGYKTANFTTLISCPDPTNLTVTLTPGNGTIANLAWTENGTTTEWDVEYGRDVNFEEYQIANASGTPSLLLENLTPETMYYARVKAYCGDEGYSQYSNVVNFTPTDAYSLTVNDGTTTNGYVPVYGFYVDQYSKSQFIIPAEDLADMQWGTISKLTFHASTANTNWTTAQFEVYVKEVDTTAFKTGALVEWTTMEKVMNAGSLAISGNKMEVVLDAPYQYMGGNLMIGIKETATGQYVSCSWYGVAQEGNTAIGGYENSKGLSLYKFLPKTTFDYEPGEAPACVKPTQLAVNYVEGTTATVSWVSDATAWNIDVNGTVTAITENPYTLTDLELNTNYEVMVQAICDNGDSEWTNPVSFTTDACMPEEMTIVNYELADSYGDGWNGNYILVVDENCNIVDALTISSGSSASGTIKVCGAYVQFLWYMSGSNTYPSETSWTFTNAAGDVLFEGAGNTSMANYDVLYTIDNAPVKVPSNFDVTEIGPRSAKLSWTENGTATAWQIMIDEDEENLIDANSNPFVVTGLEPDTEYAMQVRAVGTEGTSMWTCIGVDFYTTVPCPAPTELNVTPYPYTADVEWEGWGESYDIEWAEMAEYEPSTDALWLQYDDGTYATSIGSSSGGTWTWGVMYPATMLEGLTYLNKVSNYETSYYTSDYTINIYTGGDEAPETLVGTETVTPTANGWNEILLSTPVTIDPTQNLWITLTVTGTYPLSSCETTEPNNQWVLNGDTWANIGTLSSSLAGYGWMIRGLLDNISPEYVWNTEEGIASPYTITGLDSETEYVVKVKANCGEDGESEWATTTFTTPSACDAATDLTAEAEATSANLSWVGYQESYNLRYWTPAHMNTFDASDFTQVGEDYVADSVLTAYNIDLSGFSGVGNIAIRHYNVTDMFRLNVDDIVVTNAQGDVVASEDFESGEINLNWVNYDLDGDGYVWDIWHITQLDGNDMPVGNGEYCATSASYNSAGALFPDNWLIIPNVELGGTLTFVARGQDPSYAEEVFGVFVSTNELVVPGTDPITVEGVTNPYELTGLTPETPYAFQVQGINAECDSIIDWSEIAYFTTTELTTVMQTVALAAGTNWFSTYVEITLDDLKAALVAALPGTTITIKSQNDGSTTYNGTRWRGQLTSFDVTKMYKIEVTADSEIVLEGMPLDPAEHPVTIVNGANWIGFPLSTSMTVANAFAGFAVSGDALSSQSDGGTAYNGTRWRGQLTTLVPGQGYNYKSAATEDRTFTFPGSASKAAPSSALTILQNPKKDVLSAVKNESNTIDIILKK